MNSRFAKLLVLIAAVQILGGHWAVLQSVAWARMVIGYAHTESLGTALSKTFDGAHPCALCAAVTKGKQSEEKQEVTKLVVKLDAILAPAVALPPRAEAPALFFAPITLACDHSVAPPTPPPRLG